MSNCYTTSTLMSKPTRKVRHLRLTERQIPQVRLKRCPRGNSRGPRNGDFDDDDDPGTHGDVVITRESIFVVGRDRSIRDVDDDDDGDGVVSNDEGRVLLLPVVAPAGMDGYSSDNSSGWDSDDFSRNAKTAPSTPEAEQRVLVPPRHAESTSQLDMLRTSAHLTSPQQHKYSALPGDLAIGQKFPEKIPPKPPKRKKSRNEKFHKLFKAIPAEETILKCYSCAYFGDILLQGYLYISPNYFCFYSKILGHAKQIQIHIKNVLNISREKTAIIIPNAIGILTPQDKYVFGSLMSRDNTHRFLWSLVEAARRNGTIPLTVSDSEYDITDNNNKTTLSVDTAAANLSADNEDEEEDEEDEEDELEDDLSGTSEESTCIHCSQPIDSRSLGLHSCPMGNGSPNSPTSTHSLPTPIAITPLGASASGTSQQQSTLQPPTTTQRSSRNPSRQTSTASAAPISAAGTGQKGSLNGTTSNGVQGNSGRGAGTARGGVGEEASTGQSWSVLQILPSPQSSTLITISSVLVFVLCISAILMAYKIVLLQAKLDVAVPYEGLTGHEVYKDMYYINDQYHTATIRRFHTVLKANIHILDQVYASLRTLQRPEPQFSMPPSESASASNVQSEGTLGKEET